jgi:hydrogenase maturation factor
VDGTFSQIASACEEIGICVVGGHTEVTHGLDRPIVVGCMLGEVRRDKLVTTSGAKIGDAVVITKGIVIEGTSVIASEKEEELKRRGYPEKLIARARGYIHEPGISVVREALLANDVVPVHCMHDPTEGGLANGLYEVTRASGVGMLIDAEAIPVLPEAALLCEEFGLDPMGTLTSGTLIITVAPWDASVLLKALHEKGIKAAVIGEVLERGFLVKVGGKTRRLKHTEKDEITRLFE